MLSKKMRLISGTALVACALTAGCSSGGLYKNYPGARNEGQTISIVPYELESDSGHFCVYRFEVVVDDMPEAAAPRNGQKPTCTRHLTKQAKFVNNESPRSFFPLLDYKKVTVRLTRSPDGPLETYVLQLNGGMVNPPPVNGNKTQSLVIRATDVGVRAYRYDIGKQPITRLLIAETRETQP